MYCKLCQKHTKEGDTEYGGCGHYEPSLIFAEKNKQGKYFLVKYHRLRSASHEHWKETKGLKFDSKEEANLYAWKLKNNLL